MIQIVRTYQYCNEQKCDNEVPPGTTLVGTYETFYRQFVVNGGIESSWFHQYCRGGSCLYFGNNGDIMDLSYLDQYNEAGFFRFRMSWDNGDSIEWSQERFLFKLSKEINRIK